MLRVKLFTLTLLLLYRSNVLLLLTIYIIPILYLVLYYFLINYSIFSATLPFLYLYLISTLALSFFYIFSYYLLVLLLVAMLLAPLVEVVVVVVIVTLSYPLVSSYNKAPKVPQTLFYYYITSRFLVKGDSSNKSSTPSRIVFLYS